MRRKSSSTLLVRDDKSTTGKRVDVRGPIHSLAGRACILAASRNSLKRTVEVVCHAFDEIRAVHVTDSPGVNRGAARAVTRMKVVRNTARESADLTAVVH